MIAATIVSPLVGNALLLTAPTAACAADCSACVACAACWVLALSVCSFSTPAFVLASK